MSHEITKTDAFGYHGKAAWHRLGNKFTELIKTAVDAIKFLGLDYLTEKEPALTTVNGEVVPMLGFFAHIRRDTGEILGMVRSGYKILQNLEFAEFADSIRTLWGRLTIETCGSLSGGKRTFILFRLPKAFDLKVGKTGKDRIERYLCLVNHHGGTGGVQIYITETRVVCSNTLQWSLYSAENMIQFRHTGDLEEKMKKAKEVMEAALKKIELKNMETELLAATTVTSENVMSYFETVYDTEFKGKTTDTHKEKLVGAWVSNLDDERNKIDGIEGTLWAAFNAVSQWSDHERGRNPGEVQRFNSNFFGASAWTKRNAWKQAVVLASGGAEEGDGAE